MAVGGSDRLLAARYRLRASLGEGSMGLWLADDQLLGRQVGATLYASVEGRAPFDSGCNQNPTAMLVRLVTEPVPAPGQAGLLIAADDG